MGAYVWKTVGSLANRASRLVMLFLNLIVFSEYRRHFKYSYIVITSTIKAKIIVKWVLVGNFTCMVDKQIP
ncbi:MAG: hypothetical protein D6677_06280 [Calditrichaeota bacterium]|nr:MAG: hypothetical protein D6677_06280 [Calditrichota bacterium]